jgi:ABC-type multidrug transport system fused ATPase/permease subunit
MNSNPRRQAPSSSQSLLFFWPFFRPYRQEIRLWFFVYGLYYVLGIATPLAFEYYIDDILTPAGRGASWIADPSMRLWVFVGLYGLYTLGYHFFQLYGARGTASVIERVVSDLRLVVYEKLHRLRIRYFDKNVSGEIVNHVLNDTRQLLNLVGGELVQVTLSVCNGSICMVILLLWNLRLGLIVLAFLPAYALIFFRFLPKVRRMAKRWRRAEDKMWGNWGEKLRGVGLVQAFAREKREALTHHEFGHAASSTWYRMTMTGSLMTVSGGLVGQISQHMAYALGCLLVLNGELSLGKLITLSGLITYILAPVQSLFNVVNTWQQSTVSAERIRRVLEEVEEAKRGEGRQPLAALRGAVRFEHVSFAYETGREVLSDLSFSIEPGQKVALVGHTGSGKTSVISLLQGFYSPQQGSVLLDGIPIDRIRVQDLRARLGVVPQDVLLFQDTLRANVAYGRQGATDGELWEVLKAAQIDEFVRSLPKGLDTKIASEGGITPSAGEAQRLAIARALLMDPGLVILDEATSSLDSAEESRLQAAILLLLQGRSAIIIAHRLSTVRSCDKVLLLEAGRLVEEGPPSQLLAQPESRYARLHRSHFSPGEAA